MDVRNDKRLVQLSIGVTGHCQIVEAQHYRIKTEVVKFIVVRAKENESV